MNLISIKYYKSKIGELILGSFDNKLCILDFRYRKMRLSIDNRIKNILEAKFIEQDDKILEKTKIQIEEYLRGCRKQFDINILMLGTDFQKTVWRKLMEIPYGKTSSYMQLANSINNKQAIRAVANANAANSIGLIIPCHRIIGSDGQMVGYGGGVLVKKRLLKLENSKL